MTSARSARVRQRRGSLRAAPLWAVCVAGLASCASPMNHDAVDVLRNSIVESARREVRPAESRPMPYALRRTPSEIDFSEERLAELNRMGGPASYQDEPLELGADLLGRQAALVAVSLRDVVLRAVNNNLDVQIARLEPAISETQRVAADAEFDWVLFADLDVSRVDQPSTVPVVNGIPVGSAINKRQAFGFTTGVRKPLTTGGTLEISQGLDINNNQSAGIEFFPDPARTASLDITLGQPLLRGFGSEVALADVRLAENRERDSIQLFRQTLIDSVTVAERAYWDLYFAWASLLIQQRLLDRGVETRDVLAGRLDFDVKPAEYSDAVARVESRRADVIRAANSVRLASDRLKAIANDPDLTVGSETVLTPLDQPIDEPISISLLDSLTTALRERPDILRSILLIDDASIRQRVAQNNILPILDLTLQASFSGLAEDAGDAYEDIGEGQFVDLFLSLQFEWAIGARGERAEARGARLRRLQSVIAYRRAVQDAVLAVKQALRDLATNYQLIEQTRAAREAAVENLRTLLVEEENTRALTPDFLDLKLRRQEALAIAELEEIQARAEYNIALAELAAATGASLERNGVRVVAPAPEEALSGEARDMEE